MAFVFIAAWCADAKRAERGHNPVRSYRFVTDSSCNQPGASVPRCENEAIVSLLKRPYFISAAGRRGRLQMVGSGPGSRWSRCAAARSTGALHPRNLDQGVKRTAPKID